MSKLSLPRRRARIALTLACLLCAAPLSAQEGTGANQPVAAPQSMAQSQPATPESVAAQPASPEQQTAPEATATPSVAGPSVAGPSVTGPSATVPATSATSETTATAPMAEPEAAEPIGAGILPQSVQDALAPILTPAGRDPSLPHDLSPIGMFLAADNVVKGVMIGLAIASIATWTVLIVKMLELAGASKRAHSGLRRIEAAETLPAALAASTRRRDPVSRMIRAAATEYDRSVAALAQAGDSGVKERVDSHLDRIEAIAGRRMSRGTGMLATIGSTAPFVGLFGTVWGIMNSFIGISEAQTTNLAVVAPGIAEALLATALGLVAAIPAVVIYNVFARAITGYRLRLANASAGVRRLVSRDLDFRGAPQPEI